MELLIMRLGNYDTLVMLQKPADPPAKNGMGEIVPSFTIVATPYASVKPIRQVEAVKAGGNVTATSYTVRMYYRADVLSTWRILYRGKPLQIMSVIDVENLHKELEIIAVETGGQA